MNRLLLAVVFLTLTITTLSQENSGNRDLISTMTLDQPCESQSAAIERFFDALARDQSSLGLIMIYGDPRNPVYKLELLTNVQALAKTRYSQFNLRTFLIDEGEFGKPRAEFLIVRNRQIDAVKAATLKLDQPLQNSTLFFSDESEGSCPRFLNGPGFYFEILTANAELKGRIVIKTRDRATFKKELRRLLTEHRGVDRRRLRFVYRHKAYTSIEYWLLP
jgi:hypothetical protein